MFDAIKKFIGEALQDIDGFASSKRLALLYLLLLLGVVYIAHVFFRFAVEQGHIDALTDLIKINFAAIVGEHAPRLMASFKSGQPPSGQ